MAAGHLYEPANLRSVRLFSAEEPRNDVVAEWSAWPGRRAAKSGTGTARVRLPMVAMMFFVLLVALTAGNDSGLEAESASPPESCSIQVPPRTRWPSLLLPPQRRSLSIRPSWCGLLLASFLISGDVELNPGPDKANAITLLSQNVQSLKNKLGDLRFSAPELQEFSVVAMTETWLNEGVETGELESALPTHTLLRRDMADRVGGGVACFVRRALRPERRQALEPPDAEMLVLEIRTTPSLLIAVCYCPPDDARALAATMTALGNVAASSPGKSLVITGDFNVPDITWASAGSGGVTPTTVRRSHRAAVLLDGCHLAGLTQHVEQPTRRPNFLDLVLSNGQAITASVRDGVFPSDHREVVCDISAVRGPVPLVTRASALNYRRADWDGLRAALRLVL